MRAQTLLVSAILILFAVILLGCSGGPNPEDEKERLM
jgi:hypothetical protein